MQPETPNTDWNELQFLSWNEFKQMVPSILQLEIIRLGGMIQASPGDADFHNGLVRTRWALNRFLACLERAERDTFEESCAAHLRRAIMNISFQPEGLDARTKETCGYILDRLNYVHCRIGLIY